MQTHQPPNPSPVVASPRPRHTSLRCAGGHVRSTLALLALVPLLIASPLAAAPSASERETARALMEQGERLQAGGDLRGALSRYQSAHAIMHVPTTGLSLARVQAKLGLLVEARGVAMEVVNLAVTPGEPHVFAEARQDAASLASELEPRVASITTVVAPAGLAYTLSIDSVALPAAARQVPYRTNPGVHSVRVEAAGYAPETISCELSEGQSHSTSILLTPLVLAPNTAPDGIESGAAERTRVQPFTPTPSDDDPAAPGRIRGIIGLSAGGLALLVGATTGVMSALKVSHEKEACRNGVCAASQRAALASANTLAYAADIAIPLGVLGLGYGLYELLTLPRAGATHARSHDLYVAMTGTGAVLGGSL